MASYNCNLQELDRKSQITTRFLISSTPFLHCIFLACHPSDFEQNGMQCREKCKRPKDIHVASNPFPENPWKRDKAHTLGQRYENLQCDKNNSTDPSITCIIFLE